MLSQGLNSLQGAKWKVWQHDKAGRAGSGAEAPKPYTRLCFQPGCGVGSCSPGSSWLVGVVPVPCAVGWLRSLGELPSLPLAEPAGE